MTAAEQLRAEAQRSEDAARGLGWPYPERWDGSRPAPGSAEALGEHHAARARLFDRCADAAAGCAAARPEPVDDAARADEVLAAYLAPEREAARVEELRLVAMHERYAREAAEKMAAWRRGGGA